GRRARAHRCRAPGPTPWPGRNRSRQGLEPAATAQAVSNRALEGPPCKGGWCVWVVGGGWYVVGGELVAITTPHPPPTTYHHAPTNRCQGHRVRKVSGQRPRWSWRQPAKRRSEER